MPQGKHKTQVQLPSNIKKKGTHASNKPNNAKVSKTYKKKKNSGFGGNAAAGTGLEAVQKRLSTQIAKNIEKELVNKVKGEGKSLLLIKAST